MEETILSDELSATREYQSLIARFAYSEGAKIGYGFGKVEDCFIS